MKGNLTPDRTASIELEVLEAGGVYELIVDTGFNDYLYLPEDTIANCDRQLEIKKRNNESAQAEIFTPLAVLRSVLRSVGLYSGYAGHHGLRANEDGATPQYRSDLR
ncbi:MAG: hypothetical protein ACREBD_14580 [Blastocatellia bacterium]